MYSIEAHILCSDDHDEMLPIDMQAVELQIENIVSVALLERFETVYVTNVTVKLLRREHEDNIPI